MAYDETVAERVRQAFKSYSGVTEHRMFGGLTFLLKGHMWRRIKDEQAHSRGV